MPNPRSRHTVTDARMRARPNVPGTTRVTWPTTGGPGWRTPAYVGQRDGGSLDGGHCPCDCTGRVVHAQRRRLDRLSSGGHGPRRYRLRPRDHGGPAVDVGPAPPGPARRGPRCDRQGADARQARDRAVGSSSRGAGPRVLYGRHPCRDGCRRVRARSPLERRDEYGLATLFAATYPDRCAGLVLFDPRIRGTRSDDYPWAPTQDEWRDARRGESRLGRPTYLDAWLAIGPPRSPRTPVFCDWFVWHMRRSLSPGAALTAFRAAMELDVQ